jgi:hypothetical protein
MDHIPTWDISSIGSVLWQSHRNVDHPSVRVRKEYTRCQKRCKTTYKQQYRHRESIGGWFFPKEEVDTKDLEKRG